MASKGGVLGFTRALATELGKHGINVNAIAPGQIDTPMWDQVDAGFGKMLGLAPGEMKRRAGAAVPMGRMGTPAEIAAVASFLAGPDAAYVAAQTVNVDGANCMS